MISYCKAAANSSSSLFFANLSFSAVQLKHAQSATAIYLALMGYSMFPQQCLELSLSFTPAASNLKGRQEWYLRQGFVQPVSPSI